VSLLLGWLLFAAGPLHAQTRYLYWAGYTGSQWAIGRATLDGSQVQEIWTRLPEAVHGLAASASYLYLTCPGSGRIIRVDLTGKVDPGWAITGLGRPMGLDLDGSHLYWADAGSQSLGRALLDGSGKEPAWIASWGNPAGIKVDSTHVYWTNLSFNAIARAPLAGGPAEQNWLLNCGIPTDLAVLAPGKVFWSNAEGRAPQVGQGTLNPSNGTVAKVGWFTSGFIGTPNAICIAGDNLIWGASTDINLAKVSGSLVNQIFLEPGWNVLGLAVTPPASRSLQATAAMDVPFTGFTAKVQAGGTELDWSTAAGSDATGFNLLRGTSPDGWFDPVGTVSAQTGGAGGAAYMFTDTTGSAGVTYYYELEPLQPGTVGSLEGPLSAAPGSGSPILSFQAAPPTIFAGASAQLSWQTTGTPGLFLDGVGPMAGASLTVSPTATTSYTLDDGQGHQSLVTVNVHPFAPSDLLGLALAWGHALGDSGYAACYDANLDGTVDDQDVSLCLKAQIAGP
jgi:hypothetical protein